jgi:hypothetical protein
LNIAEKIAELKLWIKEKGLKELEQVPLQAESLPKVF